MPSPNYGRLYGQTEKKVSSPPRQPKPLETNVIVTNTRETCTTYLPGGHKIGASMEVLDFREDDYSWVGGLEVVMRLSIDGSDFMLLLQNDDDGTLRVADSDMHFGDAHEALAEALGIETYGAWRTELESIAGPLIGKAQAFFDKFLAQKKAITLSPEDLAAYLARLVEIGDRSLSLFVDPNNHCFGIKPSALRERDDIKVLNRFDVQAVIDTLDGTVKGISDAGDLRRFFLCDENLMPFACTVEDALEKHGYDVRWESWLGELDVQSHGMGPK
jgi:hypothetical protein